MPRIRKTLSHVDRVFPPKVVWIPFNVGRAPQIEISSFRCSAHRVSTARRAGGCQNGKSICRPLGFLQPEKLFGCSASLKIGVLAVRRQNPAMSGSTFGGEGIGNEPHPREPNPSWAAAMRPSLSSRPSSRLHTCSRARSYFRLQMGVVVKTRFGIPFWGSCTTHFREDCDVRWGYGWILTHGQSAQGTLTLTSDRVDWPKTVLEPIIYH